MSTRKKKILETSILLFNEKGCMNTSTRHIADELNISVGNLYYYFKNKEDIIIAIYDEFMSSVSEHLSTAKDDIDSVFDFYGFLNAQMELEKRFRFFRLELNTIYLNNPKLKVKIEQGILKKHDEFKRLYLHQMKYGYLKKMDNAELEFFCSNTWIIASQWELYWILMKYENEKLRRLHGVLNLLYFTKPYLTQKGLEESTLLDSITYIKKEISDAK